MLPEQVLYKWKQYITKKDCAAVFTAIIMGLITHMRVFVHDIPNHDGMSGIHFDQNMITSGRWFLRVACGISSDYTLPWLIGILSILYLSVTALLLQRFFKVERTLTAGLVAALLIVYPTLTSNFAYMFTADGYMLALLLAVLAVWLVEQGKLGFVWGAVALGFSMGIYQAYLSFAMVLALYAVCRIWFFEQEHKNKIAYTFRYVFMGGLGVTIYYGMLQMLLFVQNTSLSGYQGIGETTTNSFIDVVGQVYKDFAVHTLKGNILMQKGLLTVCIVILLMASLVVLGKALWKAGSLKNVWTYACIMVAVAVTPICFNAMLLISPNVKYHSLMRYQWVIIPMIALVILDKHSSVFSLPKKQAFFTWTGILLAALISYQYIVVCNIGYFNLEKKYEKTYAYCLRLLEQMEETEGYYHGMPVAMIGVVGDHYLPSTDDTVGVTDSFIGINGDYLFYTADNYKAFMEYYFGVKIEVVPLEEMPEIIASPEYNALHSFPKANSMKVVDGKLYIKTAN